MSHANEAIRLRALGFHPIVERTNSKMPAELAWQKLVNRADEELRRVFEQMPGGGIGTVTHGFIVIDLDVRPDKDGVESLRMLAEHPDGPGELPATLTSITPSGGRHLFFRVPAGCEIRNSVSKLGPGIDVRGTGGQVVLPPTSIDGKEYRWDDNGFILPAAFQMADLPGSWLYLLTKPEAPKAEIPAVPRMAATSALRVVRTVDDARHEAERRARYMATVTEPSIQGSGGNGVMMKAAFHAKEMSRNAGEALGALLEWNARCAMPAWSEDELLRALQNSEAIYGAGLDREKASASPSGAPSEEIAWVEKMQAYVARDSNSGVWDLNNPLTERGAQMALVARGVSAVAAKSLLKNCEVTIAHRVECDPSQPPTFQQDGQRVLNNYIPPTVKPAPGEFPVLAEVLNFITAGEGAARAWLVNWMAFAVQNPARQMRTVPVLFGTQGTGKSLLSRAMMALIGEQNCATVRNEDIRGKFTSHFVTKLFVAVGEIEAGEVNHATSTLKYLTGEPTLVHEAKGSAAFYVPNRIKMMCTSNQTLPVALEGESDTRWVLFKQLQPPTPEYAARMVSLFDQSTNQWNEKGKAELAAFAKFLLSYQVDVQLARSIHVNDARTSAVEASRTSIEQFIDSVNGSSLDAVWMAHVADYERQSTAFENMDFAAAPQLTGAAAVYATYRSFCKASGLQPLGMGRFPGELERHAPNWKRHKVNGTIAATRPWAYTDIPRERRLRLMYLPAEMKQGSLFSETKATTAAEAVKNPDTPPAVAAAIAAAQSIFGLEQGAEEDIPF